MTTSHPCTNTGGFFIEKMKKLILILSLIGITILVGCDQTIPTASMTFAVTDEDGLPIENAQVRANFHNASNGKTKLDIKEGATNLTGEVSVSGKTVGLVRYAVNKPGYYQSRGSYNFLKRTAFKWEPENPAIQIVLRRVKNPVAMYARDTRDTNLEIPALDTDIGFDLTQFDWVPPYGKGEVADFIFNLHREYQDRTTHEGILLIKFSNQYDGISKFSVDDRVASDFKYPYEAVNNGYTDKIEITKVVKNGYNQNYDINVTDYFFRIRSEGEGNKYRKSMYGKIHGGIDFKLINTDTGYIFFKYYLNPDYSRNVEYDVTKNLFEGLTKREFVSID